MAKKGSGLEELVRAYFAKQGYLAVRGAPYRYEDDEVTDIDVWLYGRLNASLRSKAIVDVKDKRSPKAYERILWARGMQLALGCDRAIVATTDINPRVVRYAQSQKVSLLTRQFLQRLEKGMTTSDRLSMEDFFSNIQRFPNHRQDGDWIKRVLDAKSAVVSLPPFPAFNKACMSFRFFGDRCSTRPQFREQAIRGAFVSASLACVALDMALERVVYEDAATRYETISAGVAYGDSGESKTQNSIKMVLSVVADGMENGRAVARQVKDAIERQIINLRGDVVAEYFSREHNAAPLFNVAKELDNAAHATTPEKLTDLSVDARSVIGIFADFTHVNRTDLFRPLPKEQPEKSEPLASTLADVTKAPGLSSSQEQEGPESSEFPKLI